MMSNKKICAISTVSITMEMFIIDAMRRLKEEGYDVTLVCTMDDNFYKKYSEEFRCINIKMERGNDLIGMIKSIFFFFRLFSKEKFDIIQYATPNASLYAAVAGFLSRSKVRIYCQWGIRYVGFEGNKRKFYKKIEKFTCFLSTHIRPVSFKNLHFAVEEGLYKKEKAKVLGAGGTVGIDFKVFDIQYKNKYKQEIIDKYPILKNTVVFGYIGRVVKDKGFNELILAFKELLLEHNNVTLFIIGNYEQDLDPVDALLLDWALKEPNVIFTGHVAQIHMYVSVINVLVHPSYREGFSMVIQQAQAMAIPVITTDIPGPSEVIEPNVSGLLVEVKDSKSLYEAMENLLLKENLRKELGDNGYTRATRLFKRENMLNNILEDRNNIINR